MSTAAWETLGVEVADMPHTNGQQNGTPAKPASTDPLATLRELTMQLFHQVHCLGEVQTLDFEGGVDFYREVSRFEVELIKRALARTAGNQRRAAQLLNLKVTTLNSKIKYYNLNPSGFANGYFPPETIDADHSGQV